ncbi:MAG: hypothetical protein ACTSRC_18700 [Candidatus Helarchaeota archaeon]
MKFDVRSILFIADIFIFPLILVTFGPVNYTGLFPPQGVVLTCIIPYPD